MTVPSCPGSFVSLGFVINAVYTLEPCGSLGQREEEECGAPQSYCANWSGSELSHFGHQIPSVSTDHSEP